MCESFSELERVKTCLALPGTIWYLTGPVSGQKVVIGMIIILVTLKLNPPTPPQRKRAVRSGGKKEEKRKKEKKKSLRRQAGKRTEQERDAS